MVFVTLIGQEEVRDYATDGGKTIADVDESWGSA